MIITILCILSCQQRIHAVDNLIDVLKAFILSVLSQCPPDWFPTGKTEYSFVLKWSHQLWIVLHQILYVHVLVDHDSNLSALHARQFFEPEMAAR